MEKIIVANVKAALAPDQVNNWLKSFQGLYAPSASVKVVLAVPFLYMEQVAGKIAGIDQVTLAAQTVSPRPSGNYTGATPAAWLKGLADYVLVGHRERRLYYHEDNQTVAAQVRETVSAGITPIICLDRKNKGSQLAAIDTEDLEQSLVAYTPDDSVKLEIPADNQEISDTAASFASAAGVKVLYGGGVNKGNAAELAGLAGISGLMVGKGCLDGGEFAELVNSVR
ncbi:MAG: hypothetical protein DSY70_03665 [Desulfobulbus sp.]|nr:MAG: hypothetical protein DSY70_03665 [Desulfobulbus sp.]